MKNRVKSFRNIKLAVCGMHTFLFKQVNHILVQVLSPYVVHICFPGRIFPDPYKLWTLGKKEPSGRHVQNF